MENNILKRQAIVKSGKCPDCGAPLKTISAEEYSANARSGNGHYVKCSSTYTKADKEEGKRPCVFKTVIVAK